MIITLIIGLVVGGVVGWFAKTYQTKEQAIITSVEDKFEEEVAKVTKKKTPAKPTA